MNKNQPKEKKANLNITLRGDRIFLRASGNSAVSLEIDVTPLWHFFQEVQDFLKEPSHE